MPADSCRRAASGRSQQTEREGIASPRAGDAFFGPECAYVTNAVEDTRTAARDPASSRQGSTGTDLAAAGTVSTIAAIVYARTALRGPGVGDTAKLEFVGK